MFPVPCSLFPVPCSLFPVPYSVKSNTKVLTFLIIAINNTAIKRSDKNHEYCRSRSEPQDSTG
ncbi:MAG: hypothetical protein F6K55_45020 [Moorea sp. SIO4A3]|nr:hypothetical protein [Moorena sp. SIO4A3]